MTVNVERVFLSRDLVTRVTMEADVVAHIIDQLDPDVNARPLFVAVQGPQGSGKSYLSANLKQRLSSPPYSLNVAVLSIDDLYLPHDGLVALANQTPTNPLWAGRGQPGTHDIELGVKIMKDLKGKSGTVELPIFEKSLFNGEGDRLKEGIFVTLPVDIVILEGWCVGFHSILSEELDRRWETTYMQQIDALGLPRNTQKQDVERANEVLRRYSDLWSQFNVFVQISAKPAEQHVSPYSIIYRWRLEQEHWMKSCNGGRGMSDEAVKGFVDRYIPGYIFFGDIPPVTNEQPFRVGKGLKVFIDEDRNYVGSSKF